MLLNFIYSSFFNLWQELFTSPLTICRRRKSPSLSACTDSRTPVKLRGLTSNDRVMSLPTVKTSSVNTSWHLNLSIIKSTFIPHYSYNRLSKYHYFSYNYFEHLKPWANAGWQTCNILLPNTASSSSYRLCQWNWMELTTVLSHTR